MAASMLGAGRLANVMARADACMPLGGQWEEDVRHGQGGCVYASGDKYKGTRAFVLLYTCTGSVCQCCATGTKHVLSQTGFSY